MGQPSARGLRISTPCGSLHQGGCQWRVVKPLWRRTRGGVTEEWSKQHLGCCSVWLQQEEPVKSGFPRPPTQRRGYVLGSRQWLWQRGGRLRSQMTRKTEPATLISKIHRKETQGPPQRRMGTSTTLPAFRDLETEANMPVTQSHPFMGGKSHK